MNLTVTNKLTLLNIIVFLSGLVGVFGAFQINKGAKLHELNIQHLSSIQSFKLELDNFKSHKSDDLEILKKEILKIRKEPADCLDQIKLIDKIIMKLVGTYETISVCDEDLKAADKILGIINQYKSNSISKKSLYENLDIAFLRFQKSSNDFQPLVADTVDLVFIITLFIFGLKAFALIAGGHLISKSVAADYQNLQETLKAKAKTEKKLEIHQQNLEKKIEERTRELKFSNEQLLHSEKLSAIGKLSASFAHEFNNPLFGVQNILEEIKEDVPMKEPERQLINIALSETKRMANLIKKLKSFNRPTTNEVVLCDIQKIIEDMVLLQKYSLEGKNIAINLSFEENLPKVQVIPDQLKQVILNIIQNSQDAIGENGGTISITTLTSQGNFNICIEDSGCGIAKENTESIFEPFYSTKNETNGTSLGLSVSYGIIKNHGGNISIDSEPNNGTRVTISLPIKMNEHILQS